MITKEAFYKRKCIRIANQRVQHTGSFSHTRSNGYTWYMFICVITHEPFDPYIEKNKDRDYKLFRSPISSIDCKRQAWDYISEFIAS